MKLRFKFIAFISVLFTLLMLFSVIVIYFSFEKEREHDYNKRLWAQAYYFYSNWQHTPLPDSIQEIIDDYRFGGTNNLHIFIVDSADQKVLLNKGAVTNFVPPTTHLKTIKNKMPLYENKAIGKW